MQPNEVRTKVESVSGVALVIRAETSCDLARHNGNPGAASASRSAVGFAGDISRGSRVATELVSADPELDRGQRVCATGASDFASVDRKASRPKGEPTERRDDRPPRSSLSCPLLIKWEQTAIYYQLSSLGDGLLRARDARLTLARQSCRENGGLGSLQRFVAVVKPRRLALLYRGARSAWAGRRSPIRLTLLGGAGSYALPRPSQNAPTRRPLCPRAQLPSKNSRISRTANASSTMNT
jgi:hypothetical protein